LVWFDVGVDNVIRGLGRVDAVLADEQPQEDSRPISAPLLGLFLHCGKDCQLLLRLLHLLLCLLLYCR
jgi:hypothetical protein